MTQWVTSDLHFGHENIIRFCPNTRAQFANAAAMDLAIMQAWSDSVEDSDTVYILGDVSFHRAPRTVEILTSLRGTKILVEGNHDQHNLRDPKFRQCFAEIHKYLEIKHAGQTICMFHYPIFEWNRCHYGSIMLHGHTHGTRAGVEGRILDVGYDATGRVISKLDDLVQQALTLPRRGHHG